MNQIDIKYPTLKELKALEAEGHRLRAEALRDCARSIAAFTARLFSTAQTKAA